jgi:integrase
VAGPSNQAPGFLRKRDYCILALFVGCALRRRELATLNLVDLQQREGRWVISDLRVKGGRVGTVAIPMWVKQGIEAWTAAAKLESGRLLRPVSKSGRILVEGLGDWAPPNQALWPALA